MAPVNGADTADASVRHARKRPTENVSPPSSRMRKGAVGNS